MIKNVIFGNSEIIENGDIQHQSANGRDQMLQSDYGISNHLYFYSPVTPDTVLRLNQQIHSLTKELQCQALRFSHTPASIFLHICSGGGYVMDGLNAMDTISGNEIPITTIVEGFVASAATLMSVAGNKRQIKKNSYMLIHQLSSVSWGTFQQIEDDMENAKALMKKIKEVYKSFTKVPMKNIDDILRHDLNWDSDKCKEFGLVDEII
jgi:ATP-dependent protease ClpP protease subunit